MKLSENVLIRLLIIPKYEFCLQTSSGHEIFLQIYMVSAQKMFQNTWFLSKELFPSKIHGVSTMNVPSKTHRLFDSVQEIFLQKYMVSVQEIFFHTIHILLEIEFSFKNT